MQIITGVLLTQTQQIPFQKSTSSSSQEPDPVLQICRDIASKLPNPFDTNSITENSKSTNKTLSNVLLEEALRFNSLLRFINFTLNEVSSGIVGHIFMVPQLSEIYDDMLNGKIPRAWQSRSYPSLKPLASYIRDLCERIAFFRKWIDNGEPRVFWFSAFYFPQGLVGAHIWLYAARHSMDTDLISIRYDITNYDRQTYDEAEFTEFLNGKECIAFDVCILKA